MSATPEFNTEELAALEKFKAFCLNNEVDDTFDDLDWYALSIGFFIALDIKDLDRVSDLALHARYHCKYWC